MSSKLTSFCLVLMTALSFAEVKVGGVGTNPWDIGANVPGQLPTKAGDVIAVSLYARATKLPRGQKNSARSDLHDEHGAGCRKCV